MRSQIQLPSQAKNSLGYSAYAYGSDVVKKVGLGLGLFSTKVIVKKTLSFALSRFSSLNCTNLFLQTDLLFPALDVPNFFRWTKTQIQRGLISSRDIFLKEVFQINPTEALDSLPGLAFGALYEEVAFRGIIQEGLLRKLPKAFLNRWMPNYANVMESSVAKVLRIVLTSWIFTCGHYNLEESISTRTYTHSLNPLSLLQKNPVLSFKINSASFVSACVIMGLANLICRSCFSTTKKESSPTTQFSSLLSISLLKTAVLGALCFYLSSDFLHSKFSFETTHEVFIKRPLLKFNGSFCSRFIDSIFYGIAAERTHSLIAPTIAHFAWNSFLLKFPSLTSYVFSCSNN